MNHHTLTEILLQETTRLVHPISYEDMDESLSLKAAVLTKGEIAIRKFIAIVEIAIRKFENHPSVQAIKQNIWVNQDFYFSNTEVRDTLKETTTLNNKKNGAFGNISMKRLNEVYDICAPPLNDIWNKEKITQKVFLIILH